MSTCTSQVTVTLKIPISLFTDSHPGDIDNNTLVHILADYVDKELETIKEQAGMPDGIARLITDYDILDTQYDYGEGELVG